MRYFSTLLKGMDDNHLPYNVLKDTVIEVFDKRENIASVRIVIGFEGESDDHPWMKCFEIGKFPKEKTGAALVACNNANKEYRWIRFYLDGDNIVNADVDVIVNEANVLNKIVEMIIRMSGIVDAVYPSFMQARWG